MDPTAALQSILADPARETGISVSQVVPIRRRQILRASVARLFRSRFHISIILADLLLLSVGSLDTFGILSEPRVRLGLMLLLAYEAIYFSLDLFYQTLFVKTYLFDIRERSLVIRRGVVCKQELSLPLIRITDVFLDQDIWGRLLGICDLHVSTPTTISGRRAHIVGIDVPGANALKEALLRLINRADKDRSEARIANVS